MSNPLVTVIINTYNYGRFIGGTIDRDHAQLPKKLSRVVAEFQSHPEAVLVDPLQSALKEQRQ